MTITISLVSNNHGLTKIHVVWAYPLVSYILCHLMDNIKHFSAFSLVDQDGNEVGAKVEGLLLSNGGTVCDDSFSDNSADAICREMGFPRGYHSWRNSNQWILFQVTFDISLDDVLCRSGEFTSCTYNLEHNCVHSEDVFLACDTDETGE